MMTSSQMNTDIGGLREGRPDRFIGGGVCFSGSLLIRFYLFSLTLERSVPCIFLNIRR